MGQSDEQAKATIFDFDALSVSKQRVLQSALELFVQKGYFNTSIPDLVKHSGVSTGSIYHAFRDKETLANELMHWLLLKIETQQAEILATHSDAKSRYFALVAWMLRFAEEYPQAQQFILYARHQEFMPNRPPVCSSQPFMTLREVIVQGQTEGHLIAMDTFVASSIAYGSVLRLIQLSLDGLLTTPLHTHGETLAETAWRALSSTIEA